MTTQDFSLQQDCRRWSNRILILSVIGIAYLTLFPFEIRFSIPHAFHGSPFLLGESEKSLRFGDFFLNILLFMPFGFGFAAQLRKRGSFRWSSGLVALALGACISYLVELLQLYIPGRDSGWEDVISNSMGSAVGFYLFSFWGERILSRLSSFADSVERWLSPRRIAVLLFVYFAAWFGYSVHLQKASRLGNWDPQCVLVVGNDATGQNPWSGTVSRLQIWSRALPEGAIVHAGSEEFGGESSAGLLGSYDFTGAPPYQDQVHFSPALAWRPAQPKLVNANSPELNAKSWLRSEVAVESLTRNIMKSGQFTVHVVCAPAATDHANGRIVSVSLPSDDVSFHLRQEGTSLVFWFRNPLSETASVLAWTVRNAFEAGKSRDIVAMYDGSDAFIYLDGNRVPRNYRLSPGAALVHGRTLIKTADLHGYIVVYETLVFLPAGLLIGLAARNWPNAKLLVASMVAAGLLLPAALLEIVLAAVSGRIIWYGDVALAVSFGVAGILLINADRRNLSSAV